jgi:thioredoxin-related protein
MLSLLGFSSVSPSEPSPASVEIDWMTFEEAAERARTDANPKMVFVDVYTDWCGWCKVMDKKTFSHPTIAKYMQDKFYMVKFNGEQKEDLVFRGQTYKFVASGRRGYHELAAALLQGKMSYPTVVFLNEKMEMISPVPGYHPPEKFYMIASFFGDKSYLTENWNSYQETFDKTLETSSSGK